MDIRGAVERAVVRVNAEPRHWSARAARRQGVAYVIAELLQEPELTAREAAWMAEALAKLEAENDG